MTHYKKVPASNQIKRPKLSIVVCTYNRDYLLYYCLRSLTNQTLDTSLFEVIIVDNNSQDHTRYVISGFTANYPHVTSITEPQQGLSNARNTGCRHAQGIYIAYIDDDARATPTWCEKVLSDFENTTPTPSAVGGQIHPWYEDYPPPWFKDKLEIRTWGTESGFLKGIDAKYGFSGSNMAFRKDILEKYNGFSNQFGMTGTTICMSEEVDLFCRIYESDPHFWYDPAIKIFHYTPISHMTFSYRFKRAYHCGKARANIDREKFFSGQYKIRLIKFLKYLVSIPTQLGSVNKQTVFMQIATKLGWNIGYLLINPLKK